MEDVDAVLLAAARAGDGEAFGELVRPHLPALVTFARQAGAGTGAADAVQEALLRAWRGIGGYRGDCAFRTWLFAIAWRTARNEAERTARAPLPVAGVPDRADGAPGPEERGLASDLACRLLAALPRLRPAERAAIAAVDLRRQPLRTAAAAMRLPLGTLKTHLFRGRRRLRALIDPPGGADR